VLAASAGVSQLVLFHHDPLRTDEALEAIVEQSQHLFPATIAACEGWSAVLPDRALVMAQARKV
jgi:hypothetical protein